MKGFFIKTVSLFEEYEFMFGKIIIQFTSATAQSAFEFTKQYLLPSFSSQTLGHSITSGYRKKSKKIIHCILKYGIEYAISMLFWKFFKKLWSERYNLLAVVWLHRSFLSTVIIERNMLLICKAKAYTLLDVQGAAFIIKIHHCWKMTITICQI